jgi:hypothetical protein
MISAAVGNGTTYWNNPDYFLSTGDGASYPSGSSFAPGGGPVYYVNKYIYLGTTALQLSSAGPTITSISPSGGTVGTSGAIHIYGDNLVDPFTGQASAAITGSGVTLSVASATESVVDLNDSIATNATTGSQNVTLTTRFGTSNAAPFSVGDPTPVITSISPNSWNAGTSIQVTITGHGFGTNPSLTITGPGVSGYSTAVSDTQIVATVTIAANSPGGAANVEVQSHGYTGSGFFPVNPGQPPQGSNTASVNPIQAPVPQIIFLGQNITGTQTVYVGQKIALKVPVDNSDPSHPTNLPAGLTVQGQSWSAPPGVAVGGYVVSSTNCVGQTQAGDVCASVTPLPARNGSAFTFYWIDAVAQRQITYTWTLSNQQSNSATVTFDVQGPQNAIVSPTAGDVKIWAAGIGFAGQATTPTLEFGNALTQAGMTFHATADQGTNTNGAWSFVQLLGDNSVVRYESGNPAIATLGVGLDNHYPYPFNIGSTDTTTDSPGAALYTTNSEVTDTFSATMYLMWIPNVAVGCNQSPEAPCSIPVSLGYVNWRFRGDAINSLDPTQGTGGWILGCGIGTADQFHASTTYPTWTSVAHNR